MPSTTTTGVTAGTAIIIGFAAKAQIFSAVLPHLAPATFGGRFPVRNSLIKSIESTHNCGFATL